MKRDTADGQSMPRPPAARAIRRRLLTWYARNRRDLPWRHRPHDAYAQLLAELMLQQTQVATVVPYYQRFISRFPTVHALAAADLDEVLALWAGLGYYRRGRHLHAAARQIVAQYRGQVPHTVEALMKLPGIGRYTAGAIASIAYDVRAPVLDGNVMRVLARLFAVQGEPGIPEVKKRLWALAENLLPRQRCGDFNQALMELGARMCTPASPACLTCPVRTNCLANARGLTERIPPPRRRAKVLPMKLAVAAMRTAGHMLLVQRPAHGLWAGLWELPAEPLNNGDNAGDARNRLRRKLPAGSRLARQVSHRVTRQLTHRRLTFHVYQGTAPSDTTLECFDTRPARWTTPDQLHRLGISQACRAVLHTVGWLSAEV